MITCIEINLFTILGTLIGFLGHVCVIVFISFLYMECGALSLQIHIIVGGCICYVPVEQPDLGYSVNDDSL